MKVASQGAGDGSCLGSKMKGGYMAKDWIRNAIGCVGTRMYHMGWSAWLLKINGAMPVLLCLTNTKVYVRTTDFCVAFSFSSVATENKNATTVRRSSHRRTKPQVLWIRFSGSFMPFLHITTVITNLKIYEANNGLPFLVIGFIVSYSMFRMKVVLLPFECVVLTTGRVITHIDRQCADRLAFAESPTRVLHVWYRHAAYAFMSQEHTVFNHLKLH